MDGTFIRTAVILYPPLHFRQGHKKVKNYTFITVSCSTVNVLKFSTIFHTFFGQNFTFLLLCSFSPMAYSVDPDQAAPSVAV